MDYFDEFSHIGLKERGTDKLVAVYPKVLQGEKKEVEDKVFYWYYQQSCSAEEELKNLYVDKVSDREMQSFHETTTKGTC